MLKVRNIRKKTTESFINECILLRGDRYDYSKVNYVNNKTKIKIICNLHGVFEQTPNNHLSKLRNCPKCSGHLKNEKEVVTNFINIHGTRYDYSKVNYINSKRKVEIICKEHGPFLQTPNNHLKGQNCKKCMEIKTVDFIKRSNEIHNNKYNYTNTTYTGMHNKLEIICRIHGTFSQMAHSHQYGVGCPLCNISKGEECIKKLLDENKIEYIREHSFRGCKLKYKLRFDFYLPKYDMCIEYDGKQHFESIDYYGGVEGLNIRRSRDLIKSNYCKMNNIDLLRISYKDDIKIKLLQCL